MKKMAVVSHYQIAKLLQGLFGDEWLVVATGQALMGVHVSKIVLFPGWDREGDSARNWLKQVASLRLGTARTAENILDLEKL